MNDRFFYLLQKAEQKLKTYLKNEFKNQGINITPAQMAVLFLLQKNNTRPMSSLSEALELDNSAVTRLVDRLEKSALVTRLPNPEDRREFLVSISSRGKKESEAALAVIEKTNRHFKAGISKEKQELFCEILETIIKKADGS